MERELQRTPLEEEHEALGAAMGEFAGWLMPIEYEGVLREHAAVREDVGLFDLTHLGKVDIVGWKSLPVLQSVLSNDLEQIEWGQAQYNLVLNEEGGIVDDLIAYSLEEDHDLLVPNAANTAAVLTRIEPHQHEALRVEHRTDLATLALQGPRSPELLGRVAPDASRLGYMTCRFVEYRGATMLVARSGYTGEIGYELYPPYEAAAELWRELLDLGAKPVGLGARDTLRLEMGYPLHGSDISEDRTPLEAGLSWAVAMGKGEFTGRDALARQKEAGGPSIRLRGLRMSGKRIPRAHFRVSKDGRQVGETTSGTFSPTLRVGIALAYLDRDVELGDTVEVDVRGRPAEAEVVRPPFVDRSPKG